MGSSRPRLSSPSQCTCCRPASFQASTRVRTGRPSRSCTRTRNRALSGKLIRNDFNHQLKPVVARHINQYCQPTAAPVIEAAALAGKLQLPDFFSRRDHYLKIEWQPPGTESIDPGRETKSTINQIKSLLRSPQEVTRARGRDYEEVLREIKAARDLAEQYGLTMEEVSTALANNPAAVEEQE